jgi:hypothetical protein
MDMTTFTCTEYTLKSSLEKKNTSGGPHYLTKLESNDPRKVGRWMNLGQTQVR